MMLFFLQLIKKTDAGLPTYPPLDVAKELVVPQANTNTPDRW